jgi:hypothetical protein
MDTTNSPRHSRRGFVLKMKPALLSALVAHPEGLITDFSNKQEAADAAPPTMQEHSPAVVHPDLIARLNAVFNKSVFDERPADDIDLRQLTIACLDEIATADTSSDDGSGMLEAMRESIQPKPLESAFPKFQFATNESFEAEASYRQNVHLKILPDGRRLETFQSGSSITKDALGRVIELQSQFGECLFFNYDGLGELISLSRTEANGSIHSTANRERRSVVVRDANGRVKAIGEYMSVDPWGRFYLHTRDDQYFCLDLVAGIHCERRRLVKPDGNIDYISAAFTHDGFRMATVYAKTRNPGSAQRQISYRFYGRDGSVVHFRSEEEFKDLNPSRSMPPGSFSVHASWLRARQAQSAWESVKEYLSLVAVQSHAR